MRQGKDTLTHADTSTTGRFIVRTLIFGSILIILNCYWIISAENRVVYELTDFSIFPTVLFTLFSLAGVNLLLKRFFKGLALSEAELAMTYIMVSVATALAGHDIIRQLVPLMANPLLVRNSGERVGRPILPIHSYVARRREPAYPARLFRGRQERV